MSRARPAIVGVIAFMGVCAFALLLVLAFDWQLHVKIPYAIVSACFVTAAAVSTIMVAHRRSEGPAETARESRDAEFQHKGRHVARSLSATSAAMVIAAPFDASGLGTQDRSTPLPAARQTVFLRG